MFTLKNLRLTGYVEGLSFLLLLGIAMPLKYALGEPVLVKIIGPIHGALFIWYVIVLALSCSRLKLPWWAFPAGVIGSILPFGPFFFERMLEKKHLDKT